MAAVDTTGLLVLTTAAEVAMAAGVGEAEATVAEAMAGVGAEAMVAAATAGIADEQLSGGN